MEIYVAGPRWSFCDTAVGDPRCHRNFASFTYRPAAGWVWGNSMSWVRRKAPGDPAYFCECPPCPFCFEWVDDVREDRPRRGKRQRATLEGSSRSRQRPLAQRLVLPALTGIAFALTLGLTMRHQKVPNKSSRLLERTAVVARQEVRSHEQPPPPIAQRDAPAATTPATANAAGEPPAPASAAPDPGAEATSAAEPVRQELVPVRYILKADPDTGVTISLLNWSKAALDLRVTAVDPRTGNQSMVALNIPARTSVDVTRAGLVAEHGYELKLESPGYVTRELLVQ